MPPRGRLIIRISKRSLPAAQRFYEIMSYKIFAALKYTPRDRANFIFRILHVLSPTTVLRITMHVKKQMYKVHHPHLKSGYLQKVTCEPTVNSDGIQPIGYSTIRQGQKPAPSSRHLMASMLKMMMRSTRNQYSRQGHLKTAHPDDALNLVQYFHQRFHRH